MSEVRFIHHVTLMVSDLEKSAHFYGEVLGLPEFEDIPPFGGTYPIFQWFMAGPTQLHLLPQEYLEMPRYKDLSMLTYKKHIALAVDDYEPYRQKLEDHGIAYCQDPNAKMGLKQLFCQDPDGNGVEFMVPESFDEASQKAFEQYGKRGRNRQLEELGVEN